MPHFRPGKAFWVGQNNKQNNQCVNAGYAYFMVIQTHPLYVANAINIMPYLSTKACLNMSNG